MKQILDLPTQAYLLSRFEYRDGKLFWLPKIGVDREARRWNSRYAGSEAGRPTGKGYLQVKLDGVQYVVHRLIYVISHGDVLDKDVQIDHRLISRDANRVEDLRQASHAQNCQYRKRRSDSRVAKGVRLRESRGVYEVRIQVDGKRRHVGTFRDLDAAREAYIEAARKHFGEFARAA